MTRTPTRLAVAAICGAAMFASTAAPASAEVFDQFTWEFSEQGSFDDCGFTITSDFRLSGTTVIRTVRGTQTLFYATVSSRGEDILTNPLTGEWFRVTTSALSKEGGPVTEVAPGAYTYTVRESGNTTIWDSSGRQVVRDRGLVVSSVTFDTGGDDVPGGTELGWQVVGVRGQHPLVDADFCALATDLIG